MRNDFHLAAPLGSIEIVSALGGHLTRQSLAALSRSALPFLSSRHQDHRYCRHIEDICNTSIYLNEEVVQQIDSGNFTDMMYDSDDDMLYYLSEHLC